SQRAIPRPAVGRADRGLGVCRQSYGPPQSPVPPALSDARQDIGAARRAAEQGTRGSPGAGPLGGDTREAGFRGREVVAAARTRKSERSAPALGRGAGE